MRDPSSTWASASFQFSQIQRRSKDAATLKCFAKLPSPQLCQEYSTLLGDVGHFTFSTALLITDAFFHPCSWFKWWEKKKIKLAQISFLIPHFAFKTSKNSVKGT